VRKIRPGYDWGERCPRWAGVTSEVVDVAGTTVHYLRAGAAGPGTSSSGPMHLLVHPMGTGSWSWMDVLPLLSATGSAVLAPDLPGSGRTRPTREGAVGIDADARFLGAFISVLGVERVVLHGHSMGGLVGAVFAGQAPERVERLVLTSAPLPGLPDPVRYPRLLRAVLDGGRPVARILMGAGLRLKADAWRRWAEDPTGPGLTTALARGGSDPSRISPDLLGLVAEEIGHLTLSWRIDGTVDAFGSVFRALTVDEVEVRRTLDRISAPTRLLWGAADPVIPRRLIDEVELAHPTWASRMVPGVGHLLPWEAPATYVQLAG
jgi:pimeloyl-ACP methyl ester carboxylesterase